MRFSRSAPLKPAVRLAISVKVMFSASFLFLWHIKSGGWVGWFRMLLRVSCAKEWPRKVEQPVLWPIPQFLDPVCQPHAIGGKKQKVAQIVRSNPKKCHKRWLLTQTSHDVHIMCILLQSGPKGQTTGKPENTSIMGNTQSEMFMALLCGRRHGFIHQLAGAECLLMRLRCSVG